MSHISSLSKFVYNKNKPTNMLMKINRSGTKGERRLMGVSEVTSGIIITTAVIAIVIITVGVLATMIAIAKKANKK